MRTHAAGMAPPCGPEGLFAGLLEGRIAPWLLGYHGAMAVRSSVLACLLLASAALAAGAVPVDTSEYQAGPVAAEVSDARVEIVWRDEADREWRAAFSRDPDQPLIGSVSVGGKTVLRNVRPFLTVETGIRRKGWNAFFDYPPEHVAGTTAFFGRLALDGIRLETAGNRLRVHCGALTAGPFTGTLVYTFFAGSRLVQQQAVAVTDEPNVAYLYDAGIEFSAPEQLEVGRNMKTPFAYYDTEGRLRSESANGLQPERIPLRVRYRAVATSAGEGSVAAFPAPHQYFFPRDFTSNLAQNWHRSWRGRVSLGIRQVRDTNWRFYPWANAPPGSRQRMSLFLLLGDGDPVALLDDVLRYTNRDVFPTLEGFQTLASHFHLAYTVQAMEKGLDWSPPFKPVLRDMGVNAAIIMDFHGDGHPRDLTELRLKELDDFFRVCEKQSEEDFLMIPSEEANVHFGGHWGLIFPKPVYWWMNRPEGGSFVSQHKKFGTVYSTADAGELLDLVRREDGWMYQTHARTKGSTGYPDAIRNTEHFRDDRYLGAGWKAMPADLSSPRLGERALRLVDDMQNWGMDKRLLGEVDVFQFDHTHEVYAHMNVNYIKADTLPRFENYGDLMASMRRGDFFVTTGEVLLPSWSISGSEDEIEVRVEVRGTFPLRFAEIVWGDGTGTQRQLIDLSDTGQFSAESYEWTARAPGWKWARFAVWDVAANGAFVNPLRRE